MDKTEIEEAAAMLRRILDAVESGELDAATAAEVVAVRRIEGALAALDTMVTEER